MDERKKRDFRDIIVIMIFASATYISFNVISYSLALNILGIAFLISALYGIVMKSKGKKFIF